MSLDDLEQALFEAKWGDAEEDVTEVISRILELPKEAVERVLYAATTIRNTSRYDYQHQVASIVEPMDEGPTLSSELKNAIKIRVEEGMSRVVVRWAILNEKPMMTSPANLIKDPADICTGCAHSIACIANNYSTPADCFKKGPPVGVLAQPDGFFSLQRLKYGHALVIPVKIKKDTVTVTCAHPHGTYKVAAKDLTL